MRIVQLEQRSESWRKWRGQGIGSSDIAAIAGMCPYKTPFQVWEKLMGFREDEQVNAAMQRGIDFEDEARKYLGDDNLLPACIEHDHYNYFHASLDGLGDGYFCEIKVPSQKNFASYQKEIPKHYNVQVQWQYLVSGLKSCTFLAYSPELKTAHLREVKRDEGMIEELERAGDKFWQDYLRGVPPALTDRDENRIEHPDLFEKCGEYQIQSNIKTLAENAMKSLKEEIVRFGNGASFLAYNLRCTKTSPRPSYDYEKMKEDGIDLEKYKKISNSDGGFTLRFC
jgi:putative phage-type endonuclease